MVTGALCFDDTEGKWQHEHHRLIKCVFVYGSQASRASLYYSSPMISFEKVTEVEEGSTVPSARTLAMFVHLWQTNRPSVCW